MSKKAYETALPKLRFPEFRDAEAWEETSLGQAGEFIGGGTPDTSIPEYWDGEIQWFTPTEIKKRFLSRSKRTITEEGLRNSSAKLLPKGALLLSTRATVGDIGIAENPCTTNQGFQSFVANSANVNIFWYYWFIQHKGELLSRASGSTFPEIGKNQIVKIPAIIPRKEEQQKIAATLSSLDDLLAAQTAKLGALKAHKRGLMQDLFPAAGETVPKRRFPEFRDAGEWEEKQLAELCDFTRGPFGGALKKEFFVTDGYAVYEQSHAIHKDFGSFRYNITEEKFAELKRFAVLPDDIIMSCSGTMGKFAIVPGGAKKGVINQALLKIRVKKGFNLGFIKESLELPITQEKLLSQSAGGAIKNVVEVKQIKEISIFLPSLAEQEKAINCLSSLDTLITAQSQKIDALKLHKKGLMQALFPAASELAA